MSDELKRTIRILRNEKVGTDSRGRTVWTKPIEPAELELMSTMMLEKLLESGDEDQKRRLRELAESGDGVIACNSRTDEFEVIRDADLEAALQAANDPDAPNRLPQYTLERVDEGNDGEELSLVTTQALRKILGHPGPESEDDPDTATEQGGGYNPYDHG